MKNAEIFKEIITNILLSEIFFSGANLGEIFKQCNDVRVNNIKKLKYLISHSINIYHTFKATINNIIYHHMV